jgi:hypothetical protein
MIQLATDPNASRSTWRPAAAEDQGNLVQRRPRSAHAWPFISRHGERPTAPQESKPIHTSDSGS